MINFAEILSTKENINIEAKAARGGVPNSVWDTYSAFANTAGGVILLGVEEKKETGELIPCGVSQPDKIISDLWNTLNNPQKVSANILFENHIYSIEQMGMIIVVIEVPRADRRDKPVYIGKDIFHGSFRRNNEGDYHCRREEILAMVRDQAEEGADNRLLETLTLGDLNGESIRRYRTMFQNNKPDHVWSKLLDEEFLVKIGAARRGSDMKIHPNLAGLLFFGDFTTITNELPDYFLDYRERLASDTRWSDRVSSGDGDWSGNIFDFYFKVIDRLTADVKTPFRLKDGLTRIDDTPIHASLREILANALIHADYYGRRGIVIDKKFRKVVISNPGSFRISIDEAISGGISDARNGKIFNMFSLINVGERSGSGLCDVFNVWKENGFPRPELVETLNPDRITLTLEIEIDSNQGINESNPGINDSNLTEIERKVLGCIQTDTALTAKEIAKRVSVSVTTVNRTLKRLKEKKYIERQGATRGRWIIL